MLRHPIIPPAFDNGTDHPASHVVFSSRFIELARRAAAYLADLGRAEAITTAIVLWCVWVQKTMRNSASMILDSCDQLQIDQRVVCLSSVNMINLETFENLRVARGVPDNAVNQHAHPREAHSVIARFLVWPSALFKTGSTPRRFRLTSPGLNNACFQLHAQTIYSDRMQNIVPRGCLPRHLHTVAQTKGH